jgi:hypothetical protein
MRFRLIVALLLALPLVGCSSDDGTRSQVTVELVNMGSSIQSDIYNAGDDKEFGTEDDFIPEEMVNVTFRNMPIDLVVATVPGAPFGDVVINHFRADFADPRITDSEGGMNVSVPTGFSASGSFVALPAGEKVRLMQTYGLLQGGQIVSQVAFTFTGYETTSRDKITVKASGLVLITDYGDSN